VNLHASLLPKYRGSAPIQAAILNGDDTTGVTVIRMDEGMDTGDILAQAEAPIGENDTAGTVHDTLARVGAEVLTETVDRIDAGTVTEQPQDHDLATYTNRLRKEEGVINWNTPTKKLHNFVRAMNPWPLAHTRGGGFRVWRTSVPSDRMERAEPGTVVRADERGLCVATPDGALRIEQIQVAGGTPMSASEFLRGHPLRVGEKLE
jgi:methionyl-tRNA formyltransferase